MSYVPGFPEAVPCSFDFSIYETVVDFIVQFVMFDDLRRNQRKIKSDVLGIRKFGAKVHVGDVGGAVTCAGCR